MSYIKLGKDSGGWRDFLDGKPIHCGDQLQMRDDDRWIWARYEVADRLNLDVLLFSGDSEWWLDRDTMLFRWPE